MTSTAPLTLIDNAAWLDGAAAYFDGHPIPWGDTSARAGWLAARDDEAVHAEPEPVR